MKARRMKPSGGPLAPASTSRAGGRASPRAAEDARREIGELEKLCKVLIDRAVTRGVGKTNSDYSDMLAHARKGGVAFAAGSFGVLEFWRRTSQTPRLPAAKAIGALGDTKK